MQPPTADRQPPSPAVSLHIGSSVGDAWSEIIKPWFSNVAAAAVKSPGQVVVATPFRSNAYAIKRRLLDCGMSLLGVQFLSAADLRQRLAERIRSCVASREHLRLLLSIVAEQALKLPDDPGGRAKRTTDLDFLAAKSVLRAPDHLLRAIARLGAAGWDFSAVDLTALRSIAAKFQEQLAHCGLELAHTADWRAVEHARMELPLFRTILLTGFDAAHWPLWPMLRAAVTSAEQATVVLEDPHDETRDVDEAWIGTWEDIFGEATPISPPLGLDSGTLFSEDEMRGAAAGTVKRSFLIGAGTTQQADAIAKQCLHFLADPLCDRMGIVFAGGGALPRLATDSLTQLGIPHRDELAHLIPGLFETDKWQAWLGLQESRRVASFLRFMNALPPGDERFGGLSPEVFERTLRSAYAEVLIDDLDILRLCCADQHNDPAKTVAKTLESIRFLPERAGMMEFLQATKTALDQLGWDTEWTELALHIGEWTERLEPEFSRPIYLRWLDDIARSFTVSREPLGDHPYARVTLLSVPQACNQEWSHIIFAGWNEGSWPPPEAGEFVREHEIDDFNRSIQQLNRRAVRQGGQGQGHVAIRDGHTFYLGPREQRQIACRQFETLIDSTTRHVVFSATLVQEDAPERLWNPSELLTRHYLKALNAPLTQQTMVRLQSDTERWLDEAVDAKKNQSFASVHDEPCRIAYDARRDPNVSSGEYDFAFRSSPPLIPTLSVSDFEQLLSAPALVWLKKYVGVKAAEQSGNVWDRSGGKWVHDWLAGIAAGTTRTFTKLPDAAEIERRICAMAETKRSAVADLCRYAGKPVPDWWTGGWRNAVYLARVLGEKLADVSEWPWMATEWTLADDRPIAVTPDAALRLRGRIDLLLARSEPPANSLVTGELWIVDYKTGAKRRLGKRQEDLDARRAALKKRLLDGSALQLGLYALAARCLGATDVEVSLLSPLVRQLEPQVPAADFSSHLDIFVELARMQQTGIFGMHGPLRSAFRATDDYPLASVAIDPDILEHRWENTHPALVRDEEEIFW